MLPYGDPAALTRLGCVLTWIRNANKRMWKAAAMAYVERLCLGRPEVEDWANAKFLMADLEQSACHLSSSVLGRDGRAAEKKASRGVLGYPLDNQESP